MFITLEGPDGSGKSTQVAPLVEFLRQQGYSVLPTREPGGTVISDQVRNVLLNRPENSAMHPRTEILLFLASRAQLVEERIRPALLEGTIVLCDRYADSTLAYQGYGHGVDLDTLRSLLAFATGGLQPDLTILLDVSPEDGLRRRKKGGGEWNRLDAFALAFHERVRQGYLEMAHQQPGRWHIVDAHQSPDMVQSEIRQVVLSRLQPPAANRILSQKGYSKCEEPPWLFLLHSRWSWRAASQLSPPVPPSRLPFPRQPRWRRLLQVQKTARCLACSPSRAIRLR